MTTINNCGINYSCRYILSTINLVPLHAPDAVSKFLNNMITALFFNFKLCAGKPFASNEFRNSKQDINMNYRHPPFSQYFLIFLLHLIFFVMQLWSINKMAIVFCFNNIYIFIIYVRSKYFHMWTFVHD